MSMSIKESNSEDLGDQKSKEYRNLAAILLISLGVRLLAFWLVPEPHLPTNATIAYLGGAHMLVEGTGFNDPTYPLFTPPLYAIIIAGLLSIFGTDQLPVKIMQVFVDCSTVGIIYMMAQHIFSSRVAILAAAMWGVYPFAIYATLYIGTETLFTFLLLLFILFFLYGIKRQRWYYFCVAGIVLGLATLTRGTTQFLPFILPLLWLFWQGPIRRWVANCAICLAAFGLVLLPWGIRNYLVMEDVIPVATAGMVSLWGASEELLTISERNKKLPGFLKHIEARGIEHPGHDGKPTEKDRYMVRVAWEHYKEQLVNDPVGLIGFFIKKFCRLWYATESGQNHGLVFGLNAPIYFLGLLGIILGWSRRSSRTLFPLCIMGYFIALHWVAFPLFRYMLPVIPLLMCFAACAVGDFLDRAGALRKVMRA
jgi:4-amino-4-deoxy-L-arabinose transferase-like glycosyltransferase